MAGVKFKPIFYKNDFLQKNCFFLILKSKLKCKDFPVKFYGVKN